MNINIEKLKQVTHASPTATIAMVGLGMRERFRGNTNLNQYKRFLLRAGEKIVDADYNAFWQALEELGVGKIVTGRKGGSRAFAWHFNLRTVAKAAIEGAELGDVHHLMRTSRKPKAQVIPHLVPRPMTGLRIFIPLRNDYDLTIELPANVTPEEIDKISKAVKHAAAS